MYLSILLAVAAPAAGSAGTLPQTCLVQEMQPSRRDGGRVERTFRADCSLNRVGATALTLTYDEADRPEGTGKAKGSKAPPAEGTAARR